MKRRNSIYYIINGILVVIMILCVLIGSTSRISASDNSEKNVKNTGSIWPSNVIAFSENGFYCFTNIFYYIDMGTLGSVPLCSKLTCDHTNGEICDAHGVADYQYINGKLYTVDIVEKSVRLYEKTGSI